jgi:hypothetical protein
MNNRLTWTGCASKRLWPNLRYCTCTCTLWHYGPWSTLTSLKTDFNSSLLRAFPLQPLILIFLRSSSTSNLRYYPGIWQEGLRKTDSVRIGGLRAEIWTRNLSHAKNEWLTTRPRRSVTFVLSLTSNYTSPTKQRNCMELVYIYGRNLERKTGLLSVTVQCTVHIRQLNTWRDSTCMMSLEK